MSYAQSRPQRWSLLLILYLGLECCRGGCHSAEHAPDLFPALLESGLATGGPPLPSARELRALAGIGPGRSLAVAQAFWEQGLPSAEGDLLEIAGIGPKSAAALWRARGVWHEELPRVPLVPRRADLRLGALHP